jgi:ubiquinone/menaquinone biosynthesis C-methylase UbiE
MKLLLKYISGQFSKPSGFGGAVSTFLMNCLNRKLYRATIQNLQIQATDTILDIGFGNGFLLNRIAEKNPKKVLGIEISTDMILSARKRNKSFVEQGKMELFEANVQKLPFPDNFIDKIYTINTVYFWENAAAGLSEIRRVLKPDGLFLNTVYSKKWLDKLPVTKYGFSKFTTEELETLTLHCGFSIVKTFEIERNKSLCVISKK